MSAVEHISEERTVLRCVLQLFTYKLRSDILHIFYSDAHNRGYVVSDFAQDGFALLKADRILDSVHPTDKVAGSKSVEGEGRRRDPQRRRRNKSKKLRERGDSEMLR